MVYVFLTNGIVTDVVRVDPKTVFYPNYAAQFIGAPDDVTHGWTFDGNNWTAPPAPPVPPPPPAPTKEELLAQLQALQAQIAALP